MPNPKGAACALPRATQSTPSNTRVKAYFLVSGSAEPGLVPRLADCLAKLGLVPLRLHASSEAGDGSELACDLRVASLPADEAQRLECLLRRVIGVRQVVAVVEPAP